MTIASTPGGGGPAVTTRYIWCGDAPCQARNSSNSVIKSYYAEGEFASGSPGAPYFYAPDNIGSVRRVFTSSSSPTYDYDPYGVPLQATAPITDFNYAGTFYNPDSGLYLAVNRVYNPTIGRWLSRDPKGEAGDPLGNLYAYVNGNPISLTDPEGLCLTWQDLAGLLGQIALTEVLGGGPEDPIADALVLEEIEAATAAESAPQAVDLALTYKPGWTASQTAEADAKVQILDQSDTVVSPVDRSGTSARSIFTDSGGAVRSTQDVDHAVDLQLGGSNTLNNLGPLDSSVNRSLGAQIGQQIRKLPPGTVINRVTIGPR